MGVGVKLPPLLNSLTLSGIAGRWSLCSDTVDNAYAKQLTSGFMKLLVSLSR